MMEHEPIDPEAIKAQKRRNVWLGLALAAFVIIVGAITTLRLIENVGAGAG